MKRHYQPVNLDSVRTLPLDRRPTKVERASFAQLCPANATVAEFVDTLPHVLKADDMRAVVDAIVEAYRRDKPVIVGIGGHVVKCGLSPLIIRLMELGVIAAVAMNGGASIHDFEIALIGRTSEDVAASLGEGMFGMVRETAEAMNGAIALAAECGAGMGAALGGALIDRRAPFQEYSLLAAGARLGVPVTVHVAVGGDTIHMHPSADGAALGAASLADFRLLTAVVADLGDGGVYLNVGSAVVLPEVFLKALNLARNLSDRPIAHFTTVNMDMAQHYRPLENVVRRPVQPGGRSYTLTGHHEIMLPLLAHLVLSRIAGQAAGEGER